MVPTDLNDPQALVIVLYAGGFALAFALSLFAWWRLITMDHVRKQRAILLEDRRRRAMRTTRGRPYRN